MFATIEEGLEAYKAEVGDYVVWFDRLREEYGMKREDNPMERFGTQDYTKLVNRNEKMKGMAMALGLTDAEIKALDAECGVIQATVPV